MDNATIAILISAAGFVLMVGEKIFGGGNKLAAKFASLEKDTITQVTELRFEFIEKSARDAANSKVGFEAITANIHALQLASMEFRATMAENYMRRDSFYKATDELKRDFSDKHGELKADVHRGFEEVKEQMNHLAQSIEQGRKSRAV